MTQPAFSKRLAGYPPVTLALFLFYGLLLVGWLKGGVSWWLAIIAVIAALRTFRAYRDMRTYKTWLVSWRAMGNDDPAAAASVPKKRAVLNPDRAVVVIALLLAVVLPMAFRHAPPPGVLYLWAGVCLFLLWRFGSMLWRGVRRIVAPAARRGVKAKSAEEADAPVGWLLPPASSSPSRASAERRLPQYCARLLAGGAELIRR